MDLNNLYSSSVMSWAGGGLTIACLENKGHGQINLRHFVIQSCWQYMDSITNYPWPLSLYLCEKWWYASVGLLRCRMQYAECSGSFLDGVIQLQTWMRRALQNWKLKINFIVQTCCKNIIQVIKKKLLSFLVRNPPNAYSNINMTNQALWQPYLYIAVTS